MSAHSACDHPVSDLVRVRFLSSYFPIGAPDYTCHVVDNGSVKSLVYEWSSMYPANLNRLAMHFRMPIPVVMEWSGDVSVLEFRKDGRMKDTYACYTIDGDTPVVAAMIRIMTITDRNVVANRVFSGSITKAAYDAAEAEFNTVVSGISQLAYRGTADAREWMIACILGCTTIGNWGQRFVDRVKMTALNSSSDSRNGSDSHTWTNLPTLHREITGWRIDGVTAIHDPLFNVSLYPPPFGLALTTIDDDEPPPFVEVKTAADTKHTTIIADLEAKNKKLCDYLANLAVSLNPRLSERMKIKAVDELLS